jgi:hypothetical protein
MITYSQHSDIAGTQRALTPTMQTLKALQTIETCPQSGELSIRVDSYGRTSNDGAMVGGIVRHDHAGSYFRTADGSDAIDMADILDGFPADLFADLMGR